MMKMKNHDKLGQTYEIGPFAKWEVLILMHLTSLLFTIYGTVDGQDWPCVEYYDTMEVRMVMPMMIHSGDVMRKDGRMCGTSLERKQEPISAGLPLWTLDLPCPTAGPYGTVPVPVP